MTNQYEVYHANDLFAAYQRVLAHDPAPLLPTYYHKVADVQAEHLQEVFVLTNTREQLWWYHPQVRPVPGAQPFRSTSIGDVIVQHDHVWLVDQTGFTPLQWDTSHQQRSFGSRLWSRIRQVFCSLRKRF